MINDKTTQSAQFTKPCPMGGDCKHESWCSDVYCQEHREFRPSAQAEQKGCEGDRLTSFAAGKAISTFISNDLASRMGATIAGLEAAGGHLAALVDEAQVLLTELREYARDLEKETLGGESERGEVSLLDKDKSNGRHDRLRSGVHGPVPVGTCANRAMDGVALSALTDALWNSSEVMALNAELGLTMDQLARLARAILSIAPQPAQAVQTFTEGHCDEKRKPGGCQLHNLHCGYPSAQAAPQPEAQPQWQLPAQRLVQWLHCMSYNDSYFGEPAGYLKQCVNELKHLLPPNEVRAAPSAQAEPTQPEAIGVEAVATVKIGEDGEPYLRWHVEGGIHALPEDATLVFSHQDITDDDGSGEVYLVPLAVQHGEEQP